MARARIVIGGSVLIVCGNSDFGTNSFCPVPSSTHMPFVVNLIVYPPKSKAVPAGGEKTSSPWVTSAADQFDIWGIIADRVWLLLRR